jgi:CTP:molybdopterin cytidylyltransferase MocA
VVLLRSERLTVCGLVLAAGLSTRMGDFKPLMPLNGKTMIETTIDSVFAGGASRVVVVTGYRGEEVRTLLRRQYGNEIILVENQDYARTDMLTSIQIGCRAMPPCDAFFLLPGDMPAIRLSTFQRLLAARPPDTVSIVFPTLDGYRKHPPLIDAALIPDILSFHGEGGLRQLWKQHENLIFTVPVDDEGVWVDLDTPADYQSCKQKFNISDT